MFNTLRIVHKKIYPENGAHLVLIVFLVEQVEFLARPNPKLLCVLPAAYPGDSELARRLVQINDFLWDLRTNQLVRVRFHLKDNELEIR